VCDPSLCNLRREIEAFLGKCILQKCMTPAPESVPLVIGLTRASSSFPKHVPPYSQTPLSSVSAESALDDW
jgi:hypothetical protein